MAIIGGIESEEEPLHLAAGEAQSLHIQWPIHATQI